VLDEVSSLSEYDGIVLIPVLTVGWAFYLHPVLSFCCLSQVLQQVGGDGPPKQHRRTTSSAEGGSPVGSKEKVWFACLFFSKNIIFDQLPI